MTTSEFISTLQESVKTFESIEEIAKAIEAGNLDAVPLARAIRELAFNGAQFAGITADEASA